MNIIFRDSEAVVIDWAFSSAGDPCGDVAGTWLITKLLAAAVAATNRWERLLYHVFTPIFAEIYLREYQKLSGYSRKEIKKWIPVRAGTYLDLGLPDEANEYLKRIASKIEGKRSRQ